MVVVGVVAAAAAVADDRRQQRSSCFATPAKAAYLTILHLDCSSQKKNQPENFVRSPLLRRTT